MEFETRKLQELQSTFESDWIEFRNNQKTRKLVRKFDQHLLINKILTSIAISHIFVTNNFVSLSSRLISSIYIHLLDYR